MKKRRGAKKSAKIFMVIVSILLLAGGGWFAYDAIAGSRSPIPEEISAQLSFSPFVVSGDAKSYTVKNYHIATSEDGAKMLAYEVMSEQGDQISVSQYGQPPQFVEIEGYKDRFLNNVIQMYETVQTSNGVIYLGRLAKNNNRQVGVMLERGLLVFFNPNKDIDAVSWREIGESLTLQKLSN